MVLRTILTCPPEVATKVGRKGPVKGFPSHIALVRTVTKSVHSENSLHFCKKQYNLSVNEF